MEPTTEPWRLRATRTAVEIWTCARPHLSCRSSRAESSDAGEVDAAATALAHPLTSTPCAATDLLPPLPLRLSALSTAPALPLVFFPLHRYPSSPAVVSTLSRCLSCFAP